MAFNSQHGFGHPQQHFNNHNSQEQRRLDQQLNNLTSNFLNFDINNQTEARQFNPPTGSRAGIQKRNRSRFDPPVPTRQDSNGDIEIGGTRSSRPTAKQARKARDSERRQEILRNKAHDNQFKVAKTNKNNPKKNAHKKAGTRNRRVEQKETLNAILADPERKQQRTLALQRVYAAAQKWHLAQTHKAELKEEVKRLTRELCHHTEKNYDELFHDLCQANNVKAAKPLIEEDLTIGVAETNSLSKALDAITTRTVRDTEAIAAYLTKSRKDRDTKRNAFLQIPTPKFSVNYSKTTQDTHEFKQLWKIARPLLADLRVAVEDGRELIIAHAYAPARNPTFQISQVLRRSFEEILSQVVPALSSAQIAKFEAPFLAVEEASKPKEPELPDFGGLSLDFNDVLGSMSRPWGGASAAAAAPAQNQATTQTAAERAGLGWLAPGPGFGGFPRHNAPSAGDDDEEL